MNELIRIEERDGVETVSAKELYLFLGYEKSQWSRWYKMNIVYDKFFENGVDYMAFDIMSNGNKTTDFSITVDMAKELSMLSKNEKGKEARRYFIEVEKRAKQEYISGGNSKQVSDMLNRILAMNEQIVSMLPKVNEPTRIIKTENDIAEAKTNTAKMFLRPFTEKPGRIEVARTHLYDQYTDYCEIKSCDPLGKKNFYKVVRNTGAVDLKSHGYDSFFFMK